MKIKTLFTMGALSLALAGVSTSCSNEIEPQPGNDGTVTFTVQLPEGTATRSFADGTTATKLSYAVYKKGETTPISGMVVDGDNALTMDANKSATVTLQLVNGNAYDIIFWAESEAVHNATENKPYTITWEGQTLDVNYTGTTVNDDSRDAFYIKKSVTVNGPIAETISLRRPFAQVNFGSDDVTAPAVLEAFGDPVVYKNTVTTKVYTQMNLGNGEVSNQVDYTFLAGPSALGETFPIEGDKYSYVSMCYLLVPNTKELADVTFTLYDKNDVQRNQVVVSNAPIQRNYRTNVYGSLFTSTTKYNVVISPSFSFTNNNIPVWDGVTTKPVTITDNKANISSAEELAWIQNQVAGGETFAGVTFKLTKDIDLAGQKWSPIGSYSSGSNYKAFSGTLDGNGKTIRNAKVSATQAALIGYARNPTIKNLTVENFTIESKGISAAYAAGIVGLMHLEPGISVCGTIEDCTVKKCNISGSKKVGGLVGFCQSRPVIRNNKVLDCVVYGTKEVGGIFGAVTYTGDATFSPNTVEKTKVRIKTTEAQDKALVGTVIGSLGNGVQIPAEEQETKLGPNTVIDTTVEFVE